LGTGKMGSKIAVLKDRQKFTSASYKYGIWARRRFRQIQTNKGNSIRVCVFSESIEYERIMKLKRDGEILTSHLVF